MARGSATISLTANGCPVEDGFRDGEGMPADGFEAVFPIIQVLTETCWTPLGTAFFISNNGLFATAKHVLLDPRGLPLPSLFGVQVSRSSNKVTLREVQKIVIHHTADVAIGFLVDRNLKQYGNQSVNKFFVLTARLPAAGDKVISFAFPNAWVEPIESGHRLGFRSSVSEGALEEFHPVGRDSVMLPGPCFRTSMTLAAGASGGPVAFGDGSVFGVNSTGFDGGEVSYVSPTSSLLELAIRNVRLPDGTIRDEVGMRELVKLGLVCFG